MLALLRGCVKKLKSKRVASLEIFFSWYKCTLFQRHFFWGVWFETFLNLKGCVFVYLPLNAGRKISVKGALGVGGGGEEWLKTYTSLRTRDGMVL
jgi:hypothetical protein